MLLSDWKGRSTLNTRVKTIRNQLNMSQSDFAKKLGVTAAGISKIESGKRNLTEQMLLMICKEFRINVQWLRSGEGEIFRQEFDGVEQLSHYYNLDDLDRKIILEYLKLDDKKRGVIKEYIMRIAYNSDHKSNNTSALLTDGDAKHDLDMCAEGPHESMT